MGAIISSFAAWLVDVLLFVPRALFSLLMQALAALLTAIPSPQWLQNIPEALSAVPSGVIFFLEPFQVGTGISIVIASYVLRFCIRRLPIIG